MTTTVTHNDPARAEAEVSTLQPLDGFDLDGKDAIMVVPPQPGGTGTAILLDTRQSVQVSAPRVVPLLDLAIGISVATVPVPPPAP